jgi:hypothetical protein
MLCNKSPFSALTTAHLFIWSIGASGGTSHKKPWSGASGLELWLQSEWLKEKGQEPDHLGSKAALPYMYVFMCVNM